MWKYGEILSDNAQMLCFITELIIQLLFIIILVVQEQRMTLHAMLLWLAVKLQVALDVQARSKVYSTLIAV